MYKPIPIEKIQKREFGDFWGPFSAPISSKKCPVDW